MRIGVIGCFHETNTFAPGKTELSQFQKQEWVLKKEILFERYQGTKTGVGGVLDAAESEGFELVPLFHAQTSPSGIVSREAMETITRTMREQLQKQTDSLDGLILLLHGAMVSEQVDDVEGALLGEVREIVGSKPVAITLDLHANISDDMVRHSDIIVGYDTYPHIDMYERAQEACLLLKSLLQQEIRPVHAVERPNLLVAPPSMDTNLNPMKELMEMAFKYEEDPEVLNIVVAGGFPYSDVPFAGMSVTVTTNNDEKKAQQIAKELTSWVWEQRERFRVHPVAVEQAIERVKETQSYPTIFVESADNVGGGSPADATHALKTLVSKKQEGFLTYICDAEAVKQAFSIGIGGTFALPVGGKTDERFGHSPIHGDPVHINGRVRLLADGQFVYRGHHKTGIKGSMGNVAVIELEDCPQSVVVLTENRVSIRDIDQTKSIGLEAEDFKIIVVKAAIAWKTAYGDIAKQVIEVDTPGCTSSNLGHFQYEKIPNDVMVLKT